MSILLEVCIASVDDAVIAAGAGADRLELNAALELGGLTPSLGTLIAVKEAVDLPVLVMLRPRPGGFCYSTADVDVMQRDLDLALEHGADGVVFGLLTEDGRVDAERCARLLARCGDRPAVFHRAFDVTPDPAEALETLIDLGFARVLTSGQEASAYNGAACIRRLIEQAAGRIEILPGGGINAFTVADVVARTGCTQVHASLRTSRRDPSTAARPHIRFSSPVRAGEDRVGLTDAEAVSDLRRRLDQAAPARTALDDR